MKRVVTKEMKLARLRRVRTAAFKLNNIINELSGWVQDGTTLGSVIYARLEALPTLMKAANTAYRTIYNFTVDTTKATKERTRKS